MSRTVDVWANAKGARVDADYADCDFYAHPDHRAIHEALWEHRFGAARRVKAVSRATHDHAFAATTTTRTGQHTIHYGWLDNAWYQGCESECGFSRVQAFWRRPGT